MSIKPLFIAFACEPERGSEPGIGWNCVYHASRTRPVWVITDALHRERMEAHLARTNERNINVIYYEVTRVGEWIWKRPFLLNFYYYLWHRNVAKLTQKLHQEHHFDVVHHVSYVRYWMPTAAGSSGIPFVWGPVGGGEGPPFGFLKGFGPKAQASELLRSATRWVFEHLPSVRRCAEAADIAIACSTESAERMKRLDVKNLRTISCIGITPTQDTPGSERQATKVRFISVGRLLYWKGFDLGLRAFAKVNIPNAEYVVVGGGPDLEKLKSLALRLGIQERVRFTGELGWRDGLEEFKQADVLVHPSLHDSGGFVVLEAMELSKPVICLKLGGPAMHVDSRNGFAIPAISVPQVIDDIGRAMTELASNPELRKRLGESGRNRAIHEFSWQSKAEEFERIYQQLVERKHIESAGRAGEPADASILRVERGVT